MVVIKFFKDLNKDSVKEAGGKGASLGEMYSLDIPVPNGFVVLTNSFDLYIKENNLDLKIKKILKTVNIKKTETIEKASEIIKQLILSGKLTKNLLKEINTNFKKLNCKFVAVRSSATCEDSSSAAWAGQLNTYLNTTNKKLIENIKKCWASLYTSRAIFYRFEQKLNNTNVSVAVVIQKMIDSEVSGIAFSVHPVTEDYNQLIIEAGYGLGELIVSGSITPDNYVVNKKKLQILYKKVNIQNKAIYKCFKKGTKCVTITKTKAVSQKLTDKQIIKLSKLTIKIEKHYNFPVDVEWAIEKNKIYITQSRPITTLKKTK